MKKFINDYFPNANNSSYKHVHKYLVLNIFKYISKTCNTTTQRYFKFEDKLEGEYKLYNNDQPYMECVFKHDHLNGNVKKWHVNGQLKYNGNYKNDIPHDEHVHYNIDGQIMFVRDYTEDGSIISRRYDSGHLIYQSIRNDARTVVIVEWYITGQLKRECVISNNEVMVNKYHNLHNISTDERYCIIL